MFKITDLDKAPLQSKKFIAYLLSSFGMKSYLFYATMHGENDAVITIAISAVAFIDVGYIIGQAGLDALIRYAAIIANKTKLVKEEEKTDSTS